MVHRPSWSPPFLAKDSGASASVPSVPAGTSGDKASRPALMEPATGNRCPGQPGRAAISAALESGPWQPRQRNTRMCLPRVGANAAPPHSRKRECGCVITGRRSQPGRLELARTGDFSTNTGSCAVPSPATASVCETIARVSRVTPRRPLSGSWKESTGSPWRPYLGSASGHLSGQGPLPDSEPRGS